MRRNVKSFKDLTNFTSNHYLKVNSAGYQQYSHQNIEILRPYGRVDYHILLIREGTASVQIGNEKRTLKPGDYALYYPNERQYYCFEPQERSSSYWVHFTGTVSTEVLQMAGFRGSCFGTVVNEDCLFELFGKLCLSYLAREEIIELEKNTILMRILYNLAASRLPSKPEHKNITAVVSYINGHFADPIDIDHYALIANLSRSRFSHLFKETVGMSPAHYQLKIRLEQSCRMLLFSSGRVNEIANAVGFSDPLYFSRAFHQYFGISPMNIRKKS